MASANLVVLFIIAVFSFSGVSARPCKTPLISSYTFKPLYPNPNSDNPSSSGFVTIITEISRQRSSSEIFLGRRRFPVVDDDSEPRQLNRRQDLPFGLSSYDMNSLRDRTKDILCVVVALLFGVGCGALTAASIYLVRSLFSTRYDQFDGEDEAVSPKKMGYVKIPEVDSIPKQAKDVV